MLDSDVNQSDQQDTAFTDAQNQSKSFTNRYFALSNANSLLTHIGTSLANIIHPSSVLSLVNIGSMIFRPLDYMGSLLGFGSGVASAAADASTLHYGNVQFGWTQSEEKLIDSNSSYLPIENAQILQDELQKVSGGEATIASTYANCFGYDYVSSGDGNFDPTDQGGDMQLDVSDGPGSLGNLLTDGAIERDSSGNVVNDPSAACSPINLGPSNPTYGPMGIGDVVFRWRLDMAYDTTLNQLTNDQAVSD
jgi:hypothetical protein